MSIKMDFIKRKSRLIKERLSLIIIINSQSASMMHSDLSDHSEEKEQSVTKQSQADCTMLEETKAIPEEADSTTNQSITIQAQEINSSSESAIGVKRSGKWSLFEVKRAMKQKSEYLFQVQSGSSKLLIFCIPKKELTIYKLNFAFSYRMGFTHFENCFYLCGGTFIGNTIPTLER